MCQNETMFSKKDRLTMSEQAQQLYPINTLIVPSTLNNLLSNIDVHFKWCTGKPKRQHHEQHQNASTSSEYWKGKHRRDEPTSNDSHASTSSATDSGRGAVGAVGKTTEDVSGSPSSKQAQPAHILLIFHWFFFRWTFINLLQVMIDWIIYGMEVLPIILGSRNVYALWHLKKYIML